ncbi:MAG TPA: DUF4160 domain-containing protein [Candidatus Binatia bacterium]|nr:DUF4160 domain-containing protein [Candidatus Binatia bacterium]
MPTIVRSGPYRFFSFAADGSEPPHVHFERESNRAEFWLDPVRLRESGDFSRIELFGAGGSYENSYRRLRLFGLRESLPRDARGPAATADHRYAHARGSASP